MTHQIIRSLNRDPALGYHLAEADAWLAASDGKHTTLLAYAAFELRLEIERIVLELFRRMKGSLDSDDVDVIRNFGRMEKEIYRREGHQRALDRKVAVANLIFQAVQLEQRLRPINLGLLRKGWHQCSELCHVMWTVLIGVESAAPTIDDVFRELTDVQRELREIVNAGITWAKIGDPRFVALQDKYIRGEATDDDIRSWFREHGLWASFTNHDGTSQFAGVAIPPQAG